MTKRKDLILTKDTVIDGDLIAANITCKDGMRYHLTVRGNIIARNIDARNINASFIVCESIKQKEGSKLLVKNIITKRSGYEQKEMKLKE